MAVQHVNREVGAGLADHLATFTWFLLRGRSDDLPFTTNHESTGKQGWESESECWVDVAKGVVNY